MGNDQSTTEKQFSYYDDGPNSGKLKTETTSFTSNSTSNQIKAGGIGSAVTALSMTGGYYAKSAIDSYGGNKS